MENCLSKKINEVKNLINSSVDNPKKWNEANTISWAIKPLLETLEWKVDEIYREYPVPVGGKGKDVKADIALMIDNKPRVFIEAKAAPYDWNSSDVKQLKSYCLLTDEVKLGVLTNGIIWAFCSFLDNHKGIEVAEFNIRTTDETYVAKILKQLLARNAVKNSTFYNFVNQVVFDKKLEEAWKKSNEKFDEVITFFRLRIKKFAGIKTKQQNKEIDAFIVRKLQLIAGTDYVSPDVSSEEDSIAKQSLERQKPEKPPTSILIFNDIVDVKYWKDILVKFVEKINDRNPDYIETLANVDKHWVVRGSQKRKNLESFVYTQIGASDYWLHTGLSAENIRRRCRSIRTQLNLPDNSIDL